MKVLCPRCGVLEDSRWIWSDLCADCFLSDETWTEPATVVAGASVHREDCVVCGRETDGGELCPRCEAVVLRDYDRVFHS